MWERHQGYWCFDTPACRESSYGHRLDLDRPPQASDVRRWFDVWASHHQGKRVQCAYLNFETQEPWTAVPVPPGVEIGRNSVLRLQELQLGAAKGYHLRPFDSDSDWTELLGLSTTAFDMTSGGDQSYLRWYQAGMHSRVRAGQGRWWGAWGRGQLVAGLGLFWDQDEARFQEVVTRKEHRGRGLATALISRAVADCRQTRKGPVIITARTGSDAERLYLKLGFTPCSQMVDLSWKQTRTEPG